jgi:hypothetical protein
MLYLNCTHTQRHAKPFARIESKKIEVAAGGALGEKLRHNAGESDGERFAARAARSLLGWMYAPRVVVVDATFRGRHGDGWACSKIRR